MFTMKNNMKCLFGTTVEACRPLKNERCMSDVDYLQVLNIVGYINELKFNVCRHLTETIRC
jgi:hypothetical protein